MANEIKADIVVGNASAEDTFTALKTEGYNLVAEAVTGGPLVTVTGTNTGAFEPNSDLPAGQSTIYTYYAGKLAGKANHVYNRNVNVIGNVHDTESIGDYQLVFPKGAVFAGTAQAAGIVTRGICGVTTPDSTGACTKERLYLNFDGDSTYNPNRGVAINAGSTGNNLGQNLYEYLAVRGDILKNYCDAHYSKTSHTHTFASLTSKPTTLAGYGITDSYTKTEVDSELDSRIYYYEGVTYGVCYAIDSPDDGYSMQIGHAGFTVDDGGTQDSPDNVLQVTKDKFIYNGNNVMTTMRHWRGSYDNPSADSYKLIASVSAESDSVLLYGDILIRGVIGAWNAEGQTSFEYVISPRLGTDYERAGTAIVHENPYWGIDRSSLYQKKIDIRIYREGKYFSVYLYVMKGEYTCYDFTVTSTAEYITTNDDPGEWSTTTPSGTLVQSLSDTARLPASSNPTIRGSLFHTGEFYPVMVPVATSGGGWVSMGSSPGSDINPTNIYSSLTPGRSYIVLPTAGDQFYFRNSANSQYSGFMAFIHVNSPTSIDIRAMTGTTYYSAAVSSTYGYSWAFNGVTVYRLNR